jgi:large subunit ribosomal protein L24
MLADPSDGKPTRVGFEFHEGKRYRTAKRTGKRID